MSNFIDYESIDWDITEAIDLDLEEVQIATLSHPDPSKLTPAGRKNLKDARALMREWVEGHG